MEDVYWGFDALPMEMKQLIFSFTDLDATTVLRIQSVSSSFKQLCWAWVRDLNAYVPDVTNRVNGELIRSVDCSKWKDAVNSVMSLLKLLPNVERIHFSLREDDDELSIIANSISELDQHPKLCQISYQNGLWIRSIASYSSDNDLPQFNRYREDLNQMDPVVLDKVYHRGGIMTDSLAETDSKMIVIGATDGTLKFMTLGSKETQWGFSEDTLNVVLTKNDIHKDCINAIWSDAFMFYQSPTYVASSDGIVSSWSCANDEPVLHKVFEFPESILFVCEYAEKYVLAAGKRTLYIADIEPNKIIQEIAVDDDITGLFCMNKITALSTKNNLYAVRHDSDSGAFVLQRDFDVECPNLWLSPDASLRMVVHPTHVDIRKHPTNAISERVHARDMRIIDDVTFDTRPHLAKFSPTHYWMTVSTGNYLYTYSLESHRRVFELMPSKSEAVTEYPEKCNAFWYAANGRLLFSLYSNNTLCWWRSCLLQIN